MILNNMDKINIGDKVICQTGVIGNVIKIYFPTASSQQIMVKTNEGRLYHAPYSYWMKIK